MFSLPLFQYCVDLVLASFPIAKVVGERVSRDLAGEDYRHRNVEHSSYLRLNASGQTGQPNSVTPFSSVHSIVRNSRVGRIGFDISRSISFRSDTFTMTGAIVLI